MITVVNEYHKINQTENKQKIEAEWVRRVLETPKRPPPAFLSKETILEKPFPSRSEIEVGVEETESNPLWDWIEGVISKPKREIIEPIKQQSRIHPTDLKVIDEMSGFDFEEYLQRLLTLRGYYVEITPGSGDLGVDLIASKGGEKFAIQVKRYKNNVPRTAVSDAIGGMSYYHCNKAMVITNSFFTEGAITLARSANCVLVDRETLKKWIAEQTI